MTRKTRAEKERDEQFMDRSVRDLILQQLSNVNNKKDAQDVLDSAVPDHSAGRHYYLNFQTFLQDFSPPDDASRDELRQYIELLKRFDANGVLVKGALGSLVQSLELACQERRRW